MIRVQDDVGRDVRLVSAAQRVVSLVPSLTETLFTLGRGEIVVGVTRYCTEPPDAVRQVERVGGTKNPDLARISGLRPDLVIVSAEENRKEDFEALERAGLTLFVAFPIHVRDVGSLLRRVGELIGASTCAERVAKEQEEVLLELGEVSDARRLRVFCPIWKNPWMSFNSDTYAYDMLSIAGGRNVCAERDERYCRVTLEEIAATMPEVILLPDEPYVFTAKVLPDLEPLHDTPAWRVNRVHFIDGKALSWYGPRTAPALRYLRSLLG
ncbi:MAG: helical backbone metal receptor [Candidatus Binatia bacterium]